MESCKVRKAIDGAKQELSELGKFACEQKNLNPNFLQFDPTDYRLLYCPDHPLASLKHTFSLKENGTPENHQWFCSKCMWDLGRPGFRKGFSSPPCICLKCTKESCP